MQWLPGQGNENKVIYNCSKDNHLISKIKESMLTNTQSKIGAALVKPAIKKTLKSFSASEYGGAPLLGLKGLVVKGHGNSKAGEINHALKQ